MTDDPNPSGPGQGQQYGPHHIWLSNGRHVALGRSGVRHDDRTLKLRRYLVRPNLPSPADRIHNSGLISSWGMFDNDKYGDCTAAGVCHAIMLDGALIGQPVQPTSQDCLGLYSAVTAQENNGLGFNPADPSTDTGCVELDVLNYWHKTPVAGVQLDAFVSVDHTDFDLMRIALQLFGVGYIGIALPLTAQDQVGKVWDYVDGPGNEPGSWGGHCTDQADFDYAGNTCYWGTLTWGTIQLMTESFVRHYVDEYYVFVPSTWRNRGPNPAINHDLLLQDLGALGSLNPH